MPVSTLFRLIADFEDERGFYFSCARPATSRGPKSTRRTSSAVSPLSMPRRRSCGAERESARTPARVGVTGLRADYLISVFADLSARHPEISLELELRPRLVPATAEGFDVAICMGALPDSGLIAR
jgi:DNA-binding transcriptional LysR family regulator